MGLRMYLKTALPIVTSSAMLLPYVVDCRDALKGACREARVGAGLHKWVVRHQSGYKATEPT
jgi:hypothetical protein